MSGRRRVPRAGSSASYSRANPPAELRRRRRSPARVRRSGCEVDRTRRSPSAISIRSPTAPSACCRASVDRRQNALRFERVVTGRVLRRNRASASGRPAKPFDAQVLRVPARAIGERPVGEGRDEAVVGFRSALTASRVEDLRLEPPREFGGRCHSSGALAGSARAPRQSDCAPVEVPRSAPAPPSRAASGGARPGSAGRRPACPARAPGPSSGLRNRAMRVPGRRPDEARRRQCACRQSSALGRIEPKACIDRLRWRFSPDRRVAAVACARTLGLAGGRTWGWSSRSLPTLRSIALSTSTSCTSGVGSEFDQSPRRRAARASTSRGCLPVSAYPVRTLVVVGGETGRMIERDLARVGTRTGRGLGGRRVAHLPRGPGGAKRTTDAASRGGGAAPPRKRPAALLSAVDGLARRRGLAGPLRRRCPMAALETSTRG